MTQREAKRYAHGIAWKWIECNMAGAAHLREDDSQLDQKRIDDALLDICAEHYEKSDYAYSIRKGREDDTDEQDD